MGRMAGAGRRGSWPVRRPPAALISGFLLAAAAPGCSAAAGREAVCDARAPDGSCLQEAAQERPASEDQNATNASIDIDGPPEIKKELSTIRVLVLLGMLGIFVFVNGTMLVFMLNGTMPARLAMWGVFPEAYAAVSARSVAELLRLKSQPTPAIVLRGCLKDKDAAVLAQAILDHGRKSELAAIELPHHPKLGHEGVRQIVAACASPGCMVEELEFTDNPQLGDEVIRLFEPVLRQDLLRPGKKRPQMAQGDARPDDTPAQGLQTLGLAHCGLTPAGLLLIKEVAARSRLTSLDLSWNNFTGAEEEQLAAVLELPLLKELNLCGCGLGPEGATTIAENLPFSTIRSLNLGRNGLGNEGVVEFCKGLPESVIDELDLEENGIEPGEALEALGAAFTRRPFGRLRLARNPIPMEEMKKFFATLRTVRP